MVSNISPADASAVIGGNERVVRPARPMPSSSLTRTAKKTLEARVPGLSKVVYHNKLGTGASAWSACAIAEAIGLQLGGPELADHPCWPHARQGRPADRHGWRVSRAAKASWAATPATMAWATPWPMPRPLQTPLSPVTSCPATLWAWWWLADKLETLVGMFGIGNLPTGDKTLRPASPCIGRGAHAGRKRPVAGSDRLAGRCRACRAVISGFENLVFERRSQGGGMNLGDVLADILGNNVQRATLTHGQQN